jgi:hypothetical protein
MRTRRHPRLDRLQPLIEEFGRGRLARLDVERTRGPLTVRLRDRIRSELEAAAVEAGRSLSEEIEHRIELSLARRDDLRHQWGDAVFNIAEAAAKALKAIQKFTGHDWVTDDRTHSLFVKTLNEIVSREHGQQQLALVDEEPELKTEAQLVDHFADIAGVIHPRAWAHDSWADGSADLSAEEKADEEDKS